MPTLSSDVNTGDLDSLVSSHYSHRNNQAQNDRFGSNSLFPNNTSEKCIRGIRLSHIIVGSVLILEGIIMFIGNACTRSWKPHNHPQHHPKQTIEFSNLPPLPAHNGSHHIVSWLFTDGVCLGPITMATGVFAILAGAMASRCCLIGSLAGDLMTVVAAVHLSLIHRLKQLPIHNHEPPHHLNLLPLALAPTLLSACLFACGHAVFVSVSLCSCRRLPFGRLVRTREYAPLANPERHLHVNNTYDALTESTGLPVSHHLHNALIIPTAPFSTGRNSISDGFGN